MNGPVRSPDLQHRRARRQRDARRRAVAPRSVREGKRLPRAPAGQVLLGYAERLLALAEEARGAVHDEQPRGTFRLGAMESTAAVRLPGLLSEYHKRHPCVVLELRTGNPVVLGSAILAGELAAARSEERMS